jgi:hypothetical protein
MAIVDVLVFFDNRLRQETTGAYCLRALQELVHVQHLATYDPQQLPTSGFDLYLRIDDGLDDQLPAELHVNGGVKVWRWAG